MVFNKKLVLSELLQWDMRGSQIALQYVFQCKDTINNIITSQHQNINQET
uniref:Uncharacterized protein n=1 Tax=Tetranychus urticae TaxID=32264 RepID=T1JTA7_TETUR